MRGSGRRDPLRVALVGYGEAGRILHAPLVSATPGLELGAIVTADRQRGRAAGAAHPGTTVLDDVRDVWRGRFDLVVIATPPRSHAELAAAAIEVGLATVVDKPFAVSSDQGARIVAAARSAAVPLAVFQNRRWDSDFLTLRRVLADGLVGRPIRLEARFEVARAVVPGTWQESSDPADGGGVLLDFGSHRIDQAIQLFGAPRTVFAEIRRVRPGSMVDDDVVLSLGFAGDVQVHVWLSRAVHAAGPGFRLFGTDAAFELAGSDPQWTALGRGDEPGGPGWGRHRPMGRLVRDLEPREGVRRIRPAAGSWQRFYPAMRDAILGIGPVPVDPADAVTVLRVIEAARVSADAGRVVRLDADEPG